MKRNVQEFTLVWFESTQKWVAVLDDGTVLDNKFASVGAAHGAALEATGRGEAEWEMESSTGDVQRYVKDDEYWVEVVRPTDCRNRLRDEGQPYPKSGCGHCKTGGLTGCPFEGK